MFRVAFLELILAWYSAPTATGAIISGGTAVCYSSKVKVICQSSRSRDRTWENIRFSATNAVDWLKSESGVTLTIVTMHFGKLQAVTTQSRFSVAFNTFDITAFATRYVGMRAVPMSTTYRGLLDSYLYFSRKTEKVTSLISDRYTTLNMIIFVAVVIASQALLWTPWYME